ncbi:MAG: type II toxin-antitoxin system RelE/ParE family toxin [Terriglobia bacterium]|jgi:phage-related protein
MRTYRRHKVPIVEVIFFQEAEGKTPPLIEWLDELPQKARLKCLVRLKRLEDLGHELRRPEGDYLRDGIYELRASYQGVHYRMLYFFHGRVAVVLTHGVVKEREVPTKEIDKAIRAKGAFEGDPSAHTFRPAR